MDEARLREILEENYPEYAYSEMDYSHYWKSLDRKSEGDIIEHNGRRFEVLYSWEWTHYGKIPVYMCEMEPLEE